MGGEMQIKWKCLIFTVAENSTAAHGEAQLVFKLQATTPAEWLSVLSANQTKTKRHPAIVLIIFFAPDSAVPLF